MSCEGRGDRRCPCVISIQCTHAIDESKHIRHSYISRVFFCRGKGDHLTLPISTVTPGNVTQATKEEVSLGSECLAHYYSHSPEASQLEVICKCYLVCVDMHGTLSPEQQQERQSLIDRLVKGYQESQTHGQKPLFLCLYSFILVVGLTGEYFSLKLYRVIILVSSRKLLCSGHGVLLPAEEIRDKCVHCEFGVCGPSGDRCMRAIQSECMTIPTIKNDLRSKQINQTSALKWAAGVYTCYVVMYLYYAAFMTSCLTLTSMSIERWMAICYPMKAQYVNTTSRAKRTAMLMWVVSFVLASPTFFVVNAEDRGTCNIQYTEEPIKRFFALYNAIVIFLVPLVIMAVAYGQTALALWRSIKTNKTMQAVSSDAKDSHKVDHSRERIKVIQMLMGVLCVFTLCWSPILVADIVDTFGFDRINGMSRQDLVFVDRFLQCFTFSNSCINPFLYAFFSTQFRRGFFRCTTLCCPKSIRMRYAARRSPSGGGSNRTSGTNIVAESVPFTTKLHEIPSTSVL
ncbi:hypothetical protein CAPTEDRAFT_224477 [Capitella teleta]|uniref:G-protein coupled receptors family 1 profile domain-containing protein n=1 Tax=Capitella teleta TaxID=283909 RepID=R7UWL7_CAPTE|nr:hypothetical protein CAPTEDRAFT_224477 [Capitella teleta]|eukprot:ELU11013.1 hypothetical protein CAPTEDRAFT_224477 [Capitella teleta]